MHLCLPPSGLGDTPQQHYWDSMCAMEYVLAPVIGDGRPVSRGKDSGEIIGTLLGTLLSLFRGIIIQELEMPRLIPGGDGSGEET